MHVASASLVGSCKLIALIDNYVSMDIYIVLVCYFFYEEAVLNQRWFRLLPTFGVWWWDESGGTLDLAFVFSANNVAICMHAYVQYEYEKQLGLQRVP